MLSLEFPGNYLSNKSISTDLDLFKSPNLCIWGSRQQLNNHYWVALKGFIFCDQIQLAYFSVLILIFCIFLFFQVQYIHYCWKHYAYRLHRIFYISFMEVITWKKNKEVSTICFEVRVLMQKTKKYLWNFSTFPRKKIYNWVQQFHFVSEQKYLWKHFYTTKSH